MASSGNFSNFQVLIVDDERLIQKLVNDVLTSLGFTNVTVANSGRKAIELVKDNKYDFMILDWCMHDMDGIDVVRSVRGTPNSPNRTTPIIMLTGNSEAHYVKTAIGAGINGYVIKPFSADQLVKRIRAIIESPTGFIISKKYTGPDRRRTDQPPPGGIERRKPKK
jgi:DNA-binding response OmpR family regulator